MSRIVDILKTIQNGETYNKEVFSRAEEILKAICNNTSIDITARSRYETLLLCLKNKTKTTLTPRTRLEEILVAIINGTIDSWIVGKNLFDIYTKDNINEKPNIISIKDGKLIFDNNNVDYATIRFNLNFELPLNIYTFSFNIENLSSNKVKVQIRSSETLLFEKDYYITEIGKNSITITSDINISDKNIDATAYNISIYTPLKDTSLVMSELKFEQGSTATPYSPYCFLSELEEEYYKTFGV